jgi:hypothetical protein
MALLWPLSFTILASTCLIPIKPQQQLQDIYISLYVNFYRLLGRGCGDRNLFFWCILVCLTRLSPTLSRLCNTKKDIMSFIKPLLHYLSSVQDLGFHKIVFA